MRPVARIVIASTSETMLEQLSRLLSSSGHTLFRSCTSESELRRAMDACEDGILVLAGLLPGLHIDDLVWDYGQQMQMLLIAKPQVLNRVEAESIFRLPVPASGQAVLGAVEMLTQLHGMRLPKRRGAEKETVEEAKKLLMERDSLTEAEAHRKIQQYAMNHGMKMYDYAAQILSASGK